MNEPDWDFFRWLDRELVAAARVPPSYDSMRVFVRKTRQCEDWTVHAEATWGNRRVPLGPLMGFGSKAAADEAADAWRAELSEAMPWAWVEAARMFENIDRLDAADKEASLKKFEEEWAPVWVVAKELGAIWRVEDAGAYRTGRKKGVATFECGGREVGRMEAMHFVSKAGNEYWKVRRSA